MILVFSDVHWSRNRGYLDSVFTWIAQKVTELQPEAVVFCGDLNHTHGHVDIDVLDAMIRSMNRVIEAANGRVYLISGNHDQSSKDASENVLTAFSELNGIVCATTLPVPVSFSSFDAILCPYPPGTEKHRAAYFQKLNALTAAKTTKLVAFTHWELQGVAYGPVNPKTSDHGIQTPANVDLVVNGHYHHPDAGSKYVIVGSPCYHNYSDTIVKEPRGILLLQNDLSYTRVACPVGPIYHTCSVSEAPAFVTDPRVDRMMLRVKVDTMEDYERVKSTVISLREQAESVRVVGANSKVAQETQALEGAVVDVPTFDINAMVASIVSSADTLLNKDTLISIGSELVAKAYENI